MTNNPNNWRLRGKETIQRRQLNADKARLPATKVGHVPMVRGKYGMTVEEYLEWCRVRIKPKGRIPEAKKTEEHNED